MSESLVTKQDILSENIVWTCTGWPLVREKSGKFDFLQGQGKVREFCKLVKEFLNTKKVREGQGIS